MASSSDWIAAVQADAEPVMPSMPAASGWIDAIKASTGFIDQMPVAGGAKRSEGNDEDRNSEPDAIAVAFAEGEAAGRSAAEAEATHSAEHKRALRLAFRSLDQAALDTLASELADTVLKLCEQVVAPHAVDREALAERCQEAAERLGGVAADCRLHLNPEDITMLGADFTQRWQVEPDPELSRGNIRLEGADGAVRDGPREWSRAIAAALAV